MGFLKAAEVDNVLYFYNTAYSGFRKPVNMTISCFRKPVHDSNSGFQTPFKPLGFELEKTNQWLSSKTRLISFYRRAKEKFD
jgi:hypothetical protein